MVDIVLIIWGVCIVVVSMLFRFALKKSKRKPSKYMMYYNLALMVISFLLGAGVHYFLIDRPHPSKVISEHLIWVSRLSFIIFGALYTWFIYTRSWTVRHGTDRKQDAVVAELLFMLLGGLVMSIGFAGAPRFLHLVPYSMNLTRDYLDLPIVMMIPILALKCMDVAGQIPFKQVEHPWLFPIEKVNPQQWPWRDLMHVRFQMKRSLKHEANMFTWMAMPVIEAPVEVDLGRVFRLCIQERRKSKSLQGVQDMGDEYAGTPKFCWIFYIKMRWWIPQTWFRKNRYLNPLLSVKKNDVRPYDIIIARRIPGDGSGVDYNRYDGMQVEDLDKTIMIKNL